jgi:hypothetical protein
VGRTDDNAGVAALSIDAPPFRPLADATARVVVQNHRRTPRTVALEARVENRLWSTRTLALDARGEATVTLVGPPAAGLVTIALDTGDALAVDDVAYGWLPAREPLDVLVVSDGGPLPDVLAQIARAVPGARIARATSGERAAGGRTARVVVFDGAVAPDTDGASMLVVAPAPGNALCPTAARTDGAAVVDWDPAHALLRGLGGLESLAVAAASVLDAAPWGAAVAHAASTEATFPFLVAGHRDGRRIACLAATPGDPAASTDQLSLVLLTLATLHWLQDGGAEPLAVRTGLAVPAPAGMRAGPSSAGLRLVGDPPALVWLRGGAPAFVFGRV